MDKTILGTKNELVTLQDCVTEEGTLLALDIECGDDFLAGAHLDVTAATLLRNGLDEWLRGKTGETNA